MTPNDNKPNFLDRGTLLAFALIIAFWFGWSKFMETRNPPVPPAQVAQQNAGDNSQAAPSVPTGTTGTPGTATSAPTAVVTNAAGVATEEKLIDYSSDNFAFQISSKGMGLREINLKKYKTRTEEPIILGGVKSDYPFATALTDQPGALDFVVEKTAEDTFVGRASVNGMQIEKTIKVLPETYSIDTQIKITGAMEAFKGLATTLSEPVQVYENKGFFNSSSYDHQDWFVRHEGTKTRKVIAVEKEATALQAANVSIASLSAHYFALAIVDRSDLLPKFDSTVAQHATQATGHLIYTPVSRPETFNVHYVGFAGPKSFDLLGQVDENLPQLVDYGMFGFLGKPILWLLKYLHSLIGNWGVAIILLTIIVRAIVLPFNAYSFKSMKAMQRIQPEMNRIKEKYKDKTGEQRLQMNQEIMTLMKTNKASPVGGCLPTLLQLPVFFALFQVLGQSIELYRSPFIWWIHDLSVRDQFFVLPVLMGVTMFIQQKLTPTTMDPQQAKILQWMPVIFSVFMVSLPSGLTLYIFVSTLFGIIQQYYFMRDKSTVQSTVKAAKA